MSFKDLSSAKIGVQSPRPTDTDKEALLPPAQAPADAAVSKHSASGKPVPTP